MSRDTVKGTRVTFFFAEFTGASALRALPQFVRIPSAAGGELAFA
jgi:hypothetical protein